MIVNKFEGIIDFKSKTNKGTIFYFTFGIENNEEKIESLKFSRIKTRLEIH